MAENYLITGYHGAPHVTAENDRGIQAGIVGAGRVVLPVGNQFEAEHIGNNIIRMYDGKLLDNGAAAGIAAGDYIDLLIANASQGKTRHDLIVFQYTRDPSTLIESGEFVVVQGVEATSGAADPTPQQQDLLSGTADIDQFPLWRVVVSGVTISAPVKLFDVSKNIEEHGHGNITSDGNVGTASGRILTTGTGGAVQASTPAAARTALGLATIAATGSYNDLLDIPESAEIAGTVTADGTAAVSGKAVADYAVPLTGEVTMRGSLKANAAAVTNISVPMMRNIWAGTAAIEDVLNQLADGDIYLQIEE